jgi:hypothetical protein
MRGGKGNALQEGSVQAAGAKSAGKSMRGGDQGEDVGVGEERSDACGDSLASAARDKPVVNDGNPHWTMVLRDCVRLTPDFVQVTDVKTNKS